MNLAQTGFNVFLMCSVRCTTTKFPFSLERENCRKGSDEPNRSLRSSFLPGEKKIGRVAMMNLHLLFAFPSIHTHELQLDVVLASGELFGDNGQ